MTSHNWFYREQLKRKEKLEARKKELMATQQAKIPQWADSATSIYNPNQFEYYKEEDEPDQEYLDNLAKELGLPAEKEQVEETGVQEELEICEDFIGNNVEVSSLKQWDIPDFPESVVEDFQDKIQLLSTCPNWCEITQNPVFKHYFLQSKN